MNFLLFFLKPDFKVLKDTDFFPIINMKFMNNKY